MKLLEQYLFYLSLMERQWDEPTENPDSFDIKNFQDLFGLKTDLSTFRKMRHMNQPSLYSVYLKNALGDYLGRPDMMNSKTIKHVGFNDFLKDIETIRKRLEYAAKIKDKFPKNFFSTAPPVETDIPDNTDFDGDGDSGDGADGGDSGGDGGTA